MIDVHTAAGEFAPPPPTPNNSGPVDRVFDAICWLCMVIAGLSLVFIVVSFGWLVWGRYVMNNTPTWVEQSSLLLVSYVCFLGAAVGVRRRSHLNIDFVRESFPALPREVMRHMADLMVVAFGACMAWQGSLLVLNNTDRQIPMIGLPESWRMLPMAISGVLFVLFAGWNILVRLRNPLREQE